MQGPCKWGNEGVNILVKILAFGLAENRCPDLDQICFSTVTLDGNAQQLLQNYTNYYNWKLQLNTAQPEDI